MTSSGVCAVVEIITRSMASVVETLSIGIWWAWFASGDGGVDVVVFAATPASAGGVAVTGALLLDLFE